MSFFVLGVDISAQLQQRFDDFDIARDDRRVQRRLSIIVRDVQY